MTNCLLTGLLTCKSDSNIDICVDNYAHSCVVAVKICSPNICATDVQRIASLDCVEQQAFSGSSMVYPSSPYGSEDLCV